MKIVIYFLRYLPPIMLSLVSVVLLSLFNYLYCKALPARFAEPIEIVAYSIVVVGPIAYALSVAFFFYGIEFLRDGGSFARYACLVDLALITVGLIADVVYLPRIKFS